MLRPGGAKRPENPTRLWAVEWLAGGVFQEVGIDPLPTAMPARRHTARDRGRGRPGWTRVLTERRTLPTCVRAD
jgi:hypothetical protein